MQYLNCSTSSLFESQSFLQILSKQIPLVLVDSCIGLDTTKPVLGVSDKGVSNQLQRLARKLKFHL